ncbi:MAG: DUF6252 family protein [Lutibacter sp.]|uniref:DUF6252 family protein n=1 Tax=Lutibacter sp. TaxID=1925666 RepID=UPI003858E520
MKKIILLLIIMAIFNCCKNDDYTHLNPIDQLPQATKTGENTAGCLVNDEAFLPNNGSVIPLSCDYLDGEDFTLKISNEINNDLFTILISIYNTPLQVGQTYELNTIFETNAKSGEYSINNESFSSPDYYSTTPAITGELTITHHDFDNAFLSGTFWFNAINSNGEVIEVREGRFDMKY